MRRINQFIRKILIKADADADDVCTQSTNAISLELHSTSLTRLETDAIKDCMIVGHKSIITWLSCLYVAFGIEQTLIVYRHPVHE